MTCNSDTDLEAVLNMAGYTFEVTCRMMPTQVEGRTSDDRPYYFRARHGWWTLQLGPSGWPPYLDWPLDLTDAHCIAEGEDHTGGCMTEPAVRAILNRHLP